MGAMLLRRFAIVLLCLIGLIPAQIGLAQAPVVPVAAPKQAKARIFPSSDGTVIYIVGMMMEGSFHNFDAVLRSEPKARTVYLASSGGLTIEARMIAALVRKHKLNTYVEAYCASACTQIFASGQERILGREAKLGFHQATVLDGNGKPNGVRAPTERKLSSTTVFGVNGNDTLRLAYEMVGADQAFIDKALSFSPENMWQPTARELIEAKIVTRVADREELAPPPGVGGSRSTIKARLSSDPLWQRAFEKIPDVAERALDDIWLASNSGMDFDAAILAGRGVLVIAVTRALATAPDELLDRSLRISAASARHQRERGYPGCVNTVGSEPAAVDATDKALLREEDGLIIDFLNTPGRQKPMNGEAAKKYLMKELFPTLAPKVRLGRIKDSEGKCRLGFQTYEAIDELPANKRIKAYRALLSLPGLANAP